MDLLYKYVVDVSQWCLDKSVTFHLYQWLSRIMWLCIQCCTIPLADGFNGPGLIFCYLSLAGLEKA